MSNNKNLVEDYLKLTADAEERTTAMLQVLAKDKFKNLTMSYKDIQRVVRAGLASKMFNIGDQINVKWTSTNGTQYTMPFDIVHFGKVELEDGEQVDGMYIQSHYATLDGVQFDNREAFYYAENGLSAGTYYITFPANWGKYVQGASYKFTLTKPVVAGGLLCLRTGMVDVAYATNQWYVDVYDKASDQNYSERAYMTEGASGTKLDFEKHYQASTYGYNRWSQSAIRQWLNSKADINNWWTQQNEYDMRPDQLFTLKGFMSGFEQEFLDVLGKVKVQTSCNTVTDSGITDTTYDTFFLPSLEQIYVVPQANGIEGEYWEYWKRATGATQPQAQYGTYPERITYALENHNSPQYVRLRSSYRGYAYNAWYVNSTGYVGNYSSSYAYRSAPACVIC